MSLRCLLGRHEPLMVQVRDGNGVAVKPHTVIWECRHCCKPLGATALVPKWALLARLRRDAGRQKARRVA